MPAVFAHRGGTWAGAASPGDPVSGVGRLRENTLEAFAEARRAGAHGVELDVRLCADGVPVVHHDAALPDGGRVGGRRAAALPSWLPTLVGALEACAGLAVNVELKHDAVDPGRRLAEVVGALLVDRWPPADPWSPIGPALAACGRARVLISSFDAESLEVARRAAPGLPTGLLVDWRSDPRRALQAAGDLGCSSLHPFVTQVDAGLVADATAAGLALHVWTVNAEADLAAMGRLGVAAVITDRVGPAVRILGAAPGSNGGPGGG